MFDSYETKQVDLEIVKHYKAKYDFKLFCYCLMNNHVHILIEVNIIPLSKIIKWFQQVYTQNYNKLTGR